jgi:hypothetical protein
MPARLKSALADSMQSWHPSEPPREFNPNVISANSANSENSANSDQESQPALSVKTTKYRLASLRTTAGIQPQRDFC